MRLINCHTLKLEEFFAGPIPPYYILSHRWTDDEISYQDYKKGRRKGSKGYKKIVDCCRVIRTHHEKVPMMLRNPRTRVLELPEETCYVWIDTCCIDKKSSAELSEAINSMYTYYANAFRCYAFLADLVPIPGYTSTETVHLQLQTSEWFTRGWTLQELLAPRSVVFLDEKWGILGHKCPQPTTCTYMKSFDLEQVWGPILNDLLAQITGIDPIFLTKAASVHTASLACRMSWASQRTTTRPEDTAYCLLGLLGVNMPLLYGEGQMAFYRLQEELVKRSTDQSIFAWTPNEAEYGALGTAPKVSGIFARSPADFEQSGSVLIMKAETYPYTITNSGLDLRTVARRSALGREAHLHRHPRPRDIFVIRLNCILGPADGSPPAFDDESDDVNNPDFSPIDIALVEIPTPGIRPFEQRGKESPKHFQRIHDFGRMVANSLVINEPEIVQLYVNTFDRVELLPRLDPHLHAVLIGSFGRQARDVGAVVRGGY